jgi:DNA (cytosine-5)-methyltransferase 1
VITPLKYCLSRKAIAGLERRANDRKKTLPQMLKLSIEYMQTEFWDFAEGLNRETLVVPTCLGGQKQVGVSVAFYDYHGQDKRITELDNVAPTCVRQWGTGGNNVPLAAMVVYGICSNSSNSMKSANPDSGIYEADTARTLDQRVGDPTCNQGGMIIISLDRAAFNQGKNAKYMPGIDNSGKHFSVVATGPGAVCFRCLVRRLTPKECERLQGYDDDHTKYGADGKIISDTARYRAIGNSIALPCMDYVMAKIAEDSRKRG